MIRLVLQCLIFLCFSIASYSQVSFEAKVETQNVLQGSYFTIEFVLSNDEMSNFEAPDFKGFTVVKGPMRSSSFRSVNGYNSNEIKVSYSLVADSPGTKIIKPAQVKTKNSGILKSFPIKINVSKRSQKSTSTDKNVFAKMSISDTSAVVGQQLLLYYTLYYDINQPVRDLELRREDKFSIFEANNVISNDIKTNREIIKGKEYYSKVIAVRSLIPTESGDYTFTSAQINAYYNGSKRSRFGFSRSKAVPIITNSLSINIDKFPLQSRPDKFCGAIGNYTISSSINKNSVQVDEAISMKLTISGNGKAENIIAPKFISTESLEIYDPQLISEKSYTQEGKLLHYKLYEYLLVPKKSGKIPFQPKLYVYDTSIDSFKVLLGTDHIIDVTTKSSTNNNITTEDLDAGLTSMIKKTSLTYNSDGFFGSLSHNIIVGLLFSLLLSSFLFNYYQKNKVPADQNKLKFDTASKLAIKNLEKARSLQSGSAHKAFYEEINLAMLGYIANKLSINTADLTKSNLLDRMQVLNIQDNLSSQFIDIINKVELALFSGKLNAVDKEDLYQKALSTIQQIENQINLKQ